MYRKTGDQYFDSKEFRNLLSQYETSVKTAFPIFMDVDDLTDIADYFHYIGQESEADVLIDKILELHPNAMGPIIYKVHQALENDDSNKAREIADQIIDKDSIDYLLLVGEILLAEQHQSHIHKLTMPQKATNSEVHCMLFQRILNMIKRLRVTGTLWPMPSTCKKNTTRRLQVVNLPWPSLQRTQTVY